MDRKRKSAPQASTVSAPEVPVLVSLLLACAENVPTTPTGAQVQLATYVPDAYAPEHLDRLAFMGDSITAGLGVSADPLAYARLLERNDDEVWPAFADADLQRVAPEPEVVDVAVPGATTESVLEQQLLALTEFAGGSPGETAVFVTVGGNDVQQAMFRVLIEGSGAEGEVADTVEQNLEALVGALLDPALFADGVYVYLANVYDPTHGTGLHPKCFGGLDVSFMASVLDDTNERIRSVAERNGVAMIDLHGAFLGHGHWAEDPSAPYVDPADPTVWFTSDCIHPNDRGHHELRLQFLAAANGTAYPGGSR